MTNTKSFSILCPVHSQIEQITVPIDYGTTNPNNLTFSGHISCGNKGKKALLEIKLSSGSVFSLYVIENKI